MEWEIFARTIFSLEHLKNREKLRDHAKKILLAIAKDLNQFQTQSEQTAKSQGLKPQNDNHNTAAEEHGTGRMEDGFSIN